MNAKATQDRGENASELDLSVPFTLYCKDVAKLLRISPAAVRQRARRGKIAVKPRNGGGETRAAFEWSSLDWHKYYTGKR